MSSTSLHPLVVIPIFLATMGDCAGWAYSIPTPALSSTLLPLLARYIIPSAATKQTAINQPCIVINARSGSTHANLSPVLELLFRTYTDHSKLGRRHRGLCVTLLYISKYPEIQGMATDVVAQSAIYTILIQIIVAATAVHVGLASTTILAIVVIDTLTGLLLWELRRCALYKKLRSARTIPYGNREVLCITTGTKATDAMVVISDAGTTKLEDLAEGREPPPTRWAWGAHLIGAPLLILAACALSVGFSRLTASDAWCLVGVWTPGFAHAAYSARAQRSAAALGFKIAERKTRIVQADKDMQTLVEVESIQHGAGMAFIPVFFPEKGRSEEDV